MSPYMIALGILGVGIFGSLIRVVTGPSIWDRILALSLGASKISMTIIIVALRVKESYILDLAMLFSILGFLVVLLLSRYVENRGVV